MIELNEKHPEFNMAMEVLTMLPCYPYSVRIGSLATDLGLDHNTRRSTPGRSKSPSTRSLLGMVQDLHLVNLCREITDNNVRVCVHSLSWERAKRLAEDYYRRVYGNGDTHA